MFALETRNEHDGAILRMLIATLGDKDYELFMAYIRNELSALNGQFSTRPEAILALITDVQEAYLSDE